MPTKPNEPSLAEHLESETSGADPFIINRSFAADSGTVFEMWANPDRYAKWLGPADSTMHFIHPDVREGGSSQWSMTTSDGQTKYGKLTYRQIRPNRLIVYTQNFCDENGKLCKAPFSSTYPDLLLTTIAFAAEGPGETRVTVKWEICGTATAAEHQTFQAMKPNMTGGWNDAFDKLDSLLTASGAASTATA